MNVKPEYHLSVVVVFYNMRRESRRTLFSLTNSYQQNLKGISYEVIAIDNGSEQPLDQHWVEGIGPNFRYLYYEPESPSPCGALNHGVQIAGSERVVLCIDGARITSPGMLYYSLLASRLHEKAFVYTLGMHIGPKLQNLLVDENYTQADEDRLLASVDWEHDGYSLFDISSPAHSSRGGYLSTLKESNCITLSRSLFERVGGYDLSFQSPGGGLANLDFFNRINDMEDIFPVMLLGEATFHQFHGGVATNVSLKEHPNKKFREEYQTIRGKPYEPHPRKPVHFGTVHPKSLRLFNVPLENP